MCHKHIIFGLYTEYRYRNNAKRVPTGRYDDSERWQGTVIIENGHRYGKCRLLIVFSMERIGATLPTAGSGVPGVTRKGTREHFYDDAGTGKRFPHNWILSGNPIGHRWITLAKSCAALKFSCLLTWTNCGTNSRVACDFRLQHTQVTAMLV